MQPNKDLILVIGAKSKSLKEHLNITALFHPDITLQ